MKFETILHPKTHDEMNLFNLLTKKNNRTPSASTNTGSYIGMSSESVAQIMEHFPVGMRIQYYPEYQKSIKIDSIIVAYSINDHLIYSNKDITAATREGQRGFQARIQGSPMFFDRVSSFNILVPKLIRQAIELHRPPGKANLKKEMVERQVNDFRVGNSITMFYRSTPAKGILQLDTTVKRTVTLKEGLYPNKGLAVLQPLLDTFECIDFRAMARIDTEIPSEFFIDKNGKGHPCLIQDFSEKFIRIQIDEKHKRLLQGIGEGRKVVIKVNPEFHGRNLILQGQVFRKRGHTVIIALENLLKKGRFHPMDALDEIYIKSAMLEHPNTKT